MNKYEILTLYIEKTYVSHWYPLTIVTDHVPVCF